MDISTIVVAVVILILGFLFKAEVKKLISWLVSFKRISKTSDGYALEPGTEPPDRATTTNSAELERSRATKEIEPPAQDDVAGNPEDWIDLSLRGNYEKALAVLERELAAAEDDGERIQIRSYKGNVLFERDAEEGKRYFEELILTHPANEHVYLWYSLSYYFSGGHSEALAVVDRGLERLPESVRLIEAKAETLVRSGREEAAIDVLRAALRRHETSGSLYIALARRLEQQKADTHDVEEVLRSGLLKNPSSEQIRAKLASLLWETDRSEEALVQYKTLLMIDHEDPNYWSMLGNVYLSLELFDLSLAAYENARALTDGKEAWIIANIGNLYSRRGLYTKAIAHLREAVEIEPGSEYAQDRLAKAMAAKKAEGANAEEAERSGRKSSASVTPQGASMQESTTGAD